MSKRIECLFKLMEYDYLTEKQAALVRSFKNQFKYVGMLTDRQIEILEDINVQATDKATS